MKERKLDLVEGDLPPSAPAPEEPCERLRRAKIICTIGPACDSEEMIRDLMRTGMDVARLNFSHGTHPEHARRIQRLRRAARQLKRSICILQDLQGPKIRTGRLKDGKPVLLKAGSVLTITPRKLAGTAELISTDFAGLAREVEPGARVLLSDGRIELKVRSIRGEDVECEVLNGGTLGEQQGINLPGAAVAIPALTEKDKLDLKFGLKHGVDVVALSFVRSADDIREAKNLMREFGKSVPIIAKLEKPQAIERLEEILEVANAVMVARGDLGVEVPPERVPIIQKLVIQRAGVWRKPVITATQMLESMVNNPRPTRAEASDVANAVLDGSDAVMLSAESASGRYPLEAVATMKRIIRATEEDRERQGQYRRRTADVVPVHEGIAMAACALAEQVNAQAIACVTLTGSIARAISKHRPARPIYAVSQHDGVLRQLSVHWGVEGVRLQNLDTNIDDALSAIEHALVASGRLKSGDQLVLTAGLPFAARQATNMVRVDRVR